MRITCSIAIASLVTYGTWAVVSGFLNCIPVAKFWDTSIGGFCFSKKALWFSNASVHILTDVAIFVIPIPVLRSLRLPLKQRIGVILIFALGSLYVNDFLPFKVPSSSSSSFPHWISFLIVHSRE